MTFFEKAGLAHLHVHLFGSIEVRFCITFIASIAKRTKGRLKWHGMFNYILAFSAKLRSNTLHTQLIFNALK